MGRRNTHLEPTLHYESVTGGKDWGVNEAGMQQMDDNAGYVPKKLEDMGQLDNTAVVFTADNGTEAISFPDGGVSPFKGLKGEVWEGGHRVPCVIRWPGHIKPGTIYNQLFAALDWLPIRAGGRHRPEERNEHRRRTCRPGDRISIRLEHAPDRSAVVAGTPRILGKIPTARDSGVLQSEWNHRPDEGSSIDEPRRRIGNLSGSELSLGGAPLGAPPRQPGLATLSSPD
jgi:hypothetical protein